MIVGTAELPKKLRVWIENGGSSGDAARIASILDAAATITDILVLMRASGMQLVGVGHNIWRVMDSRQNEVLTFRFFEKPSGNSEVTIV